MLNRKIDRIRDKAKFAGFGMQFNGFCNHVFTFYRDMRMQCYLGKTTVSVLFLAQYSLRCVHIRLHDNVVHGTKMQVPQHMAGRKRRHKKIFRIVPGAVAPKSRIRRAQNQRFVFNSDGMASFVVFIMVGSGTGIAGPFNFRLVGMFFHNTIV